MIEKTTYSSQKMNTNSVYTKEIDWPEFGEATPVLYPSASELQERIFACRKEMISRGLTHLVVYGDREHFGNIMYLTHFDPRFEEAILIIGQTGCLFVYPAYYRYRLLSEGLSSLQGTV